MKTGLLKLHVHQEPGDISVTMVVRKGAG